MSRRQSEHKHFLDRFLNALNDFLKSQVVTQKQNVRQMSYKDQAVLFFMHTHIHTHITTLK